VDIGTTTVTLWLVDLITGQVKAQVSEYNGQIARGEDVISRIIFAGKNGGDELRQRVLETINNLLELACKRVKMPQGFVTPDQVVKVTIAGNSTMIHLLLGIPAGSIRLSPFITAVNHPPLMTGRDVGVNTNPDAVVDCLPGVASYVGADITAGVLSSGLEKAENVTLFLDVGTNGEIVLGDRDWLVTCACSAGPDSRRLRAHRRGVLRPDHARRRCLYRHRQYGAQRCSGRCAGLQPARRKNPRGLDRAEAPADERTKNLMCGIVGTFRFDGRPVDQELLRQQVSAIRHRGPDGNGTWTSRSVGLGHTRLAIIDLIVEKGAKPGKPSK
jgi:hypothetical protein